MALQREEILKQGMENVLNYIKDLEKRIVVLEEIIEDITEDVPETAGHVTWVHDHDNSFKPQSWASQAK